MYLNARLTFFSCFIVCIMTHATFAENPRAERLYETALNKYIAGDLRKSSEIIIRAIKIDDNNAKYHRLSGDINYAKEEWQKAISEYLMSINLDSSYSDLYYKMAKALLYSRKFKDSISYYKHYLQIYNTDTTAWKEITQIFEASNNYLEANFCYNKLRELGVANKVNQTRVQYINDHPDIDSLIAKAIITGAAVIGMNAEQIKASMGEPIDINRTVYEWGVQEQWVYGRPPQIFLYLENGILKSFQD